MTSTFDWLEGIFNIMETKEADAVLKEKAIKLAEKCKKEIEEKIGKVKVPFKDSWYWYFATVHSDFDHTKEWHLKLISPELDEEIEKLFQEFVGERIE